MMNIRPFAATLVTGAGITAALLGAGTASADSFGTPNSGSPHIIDKTTQVQHHDAVSRHLRNIHLFKVVEDPFEEG
jgi:hypothetical protein